MAIAVEREAEKSTVKVEAALVVKLETRETPASVQRADRFHVMPTRCRQNPMGCLMQELMKAIATLILNSSITLATKSVSEMAEMAAEIVAAAAEMHPPSIVRRPPLLAKPPRLGMRIAIVQAATYLMFSFGSLNRFLASSRRRKMKKRKSGWSYPKSVNLGTIGGVEGVEIVFPVSHLKSSMSR